MLITTAHKKGDGTEWPHWLCPAVVKHAVPDFFVRRNTIYDDEDDAIREALCKEAERRERRRDRERARYWERKGRQVPPRRSHNEREAIL